MINQSTLEKLRVMRLGAMAFAVESQTNDSAYKELSFEERFSILVDAEFQRRESNKLQRLIRYATFRHPNACMEDIEYHSDRKLDKSLLTSLSSCNFIGQGHHVILEGAAGNGKTFIACALGNAACRNFKRVKYNWLPELLNDLVIAKGEGNYKKVIKSYQKLDLLILDEWLLNPLSIDQAMELFEIIEARTRNGAMIFCIQFDPRGWYDRIGTAEDGTLSEAIIDRIKHNAHEIVIKGNVSMRERHGIHFHEKGGAHHG